MSFLKRIGAAMLCTVFVFTGCSASSSKGQNCAVQPEQQLVLYTSHPEEIYEPFIREFEERTGVWVRVISGGTQELLDRIQQEKDAPAADVMFGGGVESLEGCSACFTSYHSGESDAATIAAISDPRDRWTSFSALPLVIIYNTKLVSERDAPTTWSSLLDSKWQGRIAFADPQVSGSCYTALATAVQLYGTEYLPDFARNLKGRCLQESREIALRVADGSYSVGVTLESNALQTIAEGADIAYLYPEDGTSAVPDGVAVLAGAPHPENARQFVDFVLGRDAQAYLAGELHRHAVREELSPKGVQKLENIPLMEYDVKWAAKEKSSLLALWTKEFAPAEEDRK